MIFSLPSLKKLGADLQAAVKRFPLVSVMALLWTVSALYAVEFGEAQSQVPHAVLKFMFMCQLGFALLLALQLFGEQKKLVASTRLKFNLGAVAFLAVYYFLLPEKIFEEPDYHLFRYFLWLLSFCLAVTFGAFLNKEPVLAFWEFNKKVFTQLVVAVVFTGTLYLGLVLTMASFEYLFEIDIDGHRYAELFILLVGLMATHILLAGVPTQFKLSQTFSYSRLTKSFARFILVPLMALYTFILLLYAVKILSTGQWPRGQLCYMVLIYALVGMLTDVLLYPCRDESGHGWVKVTTKIFYVLLLPTSLLLFGAIYQRIAQHGLTENRYFVVLLGAWVVALAIYFLRKSEHNLKIIPVSLFAVALLASFGPWGAFAVSKCHQLNRLEKILATYNLINNDGQIIPASETTAVNSEDLNELSGIFDYLAERHGRQVLAPYFTSDISGLAEPDLTKNLMELAGLRYVSRWDRYLESPRPQWAHFRLDTKSAIALEDAKYLVQGHYEDTQEFTVEGVTFTLSRQLNGARYAVKQAGSTVAEFNLESLAKQLAAIYGSGYKDALPASELQLENNGWRLQIVDLSFNSEADSKHRIRGQVWLLIP